MSLSASDVAGANNKTLVRISRCKTKWVEKRFRTKVGRCIF